MLIRTYQPGDEHAQARIYNTAAGPLPAFKQADADEIVQRHQSEDADDGARYFAVDGTEVVGYAAFCPSGRISYPWCLPGAEAVQGPLLDAVLEDMTRRGMPEAWSAYRSDWSTVLDFFKAHDFHEKRQMINYLAEVAWMPDRPEVPDNRVIERLDRRAIGELTAMAPGLFSSVESRSLEAFFWEHPHYDFSESLFALEEAGTRRLLGVSLLVLSDRFADPSRIDAAMPCFRLGAFGSERERHKRVNGLYSCVFLDPAEAELLLAAPDWSRARAAGLTHVAAQAPSDASALCAFYDRYFQRQGAFPILARRLG